jgi:hypothetical protein
VIEIDSFLPQQFSDIFERLFSSVNLVEWGIVFEGRSRDDEFRVRNFGEPFRVLFVAVVDDLLEEDLDATRPKISDEM